MVDVTSRLRLVVDSTGLDKSGRKLRDLRNRTREADDAARRLRTAFAGLAGVVGAAFSVRAITQMADEFQSISNRLRLVTGGAGELRDVMQSLGVIARNSQSSLETTVTLFSRVEQFAGDAFKSQQQALDFTAAIQNAFLAAGAGAQEASNAVRQLTQGLASGQLRGEEFRAVSEQAPLLAKALEELGDGTKSVFDLAKEGFFTTGRVVEAILGKTEEFAEQAAKVAPTIGRSLQVLRNELLLTFGDTFDSISSNVAGFVLFIADNLEAIKPIAEGVAASVLAIGAAFVTPAIVAGVTALLSPLALLAIAIGAVVAFRDDIAEWAFGVRDAGAVVRAAIEVVTPMFRALLQAIGDFVSPAISLLVEFAQLVARIFKNVTQTIMGFAAFVKEQINEFQTIAATQKVNAITEELKAATEEFRELQADPLVPEFALEAHRKEITALIERAREAKAELDSLINPEQKDASGLGKIFNDIKARAEELKNAADEVADAPGPERMRKEVEALSSASKEATKDASQLAAIFTDLETERRALLAETDREADIIRVTADLLKNQVEHYKAMGAEAEKAAKADAGRIVDLRKGNEALEARRKIQKDIAEQQEIIQAAALGERQERIAREILEIRREIAGIGIEEARALAEQNVALEEQLEIIRKQRELIEAPFENLADNLENAIINGGKAGVDGLDDIFKNFLHDLKNAFLLSVFQPLLRQVRNLTSGISVPIFGPQAGVAGPGIFSSSLFGTPTGQQGLRGGAGGFGINSANLNTFGAPGIGGLSSFSPFSFLQSGISGFGALGGQSLVGLGNLLGAGPTALSALNLGGSLLGAGGFGFLAGSTLSDLFGLEGKGKGALTGAATGASLGFQLGTIVPGIGNVVGAIGGAIIGGISGLLGGNKPSVHGTSVGVGLQSGSIIDQFKAKGGDQNAAARDAIIDQALTTVNAIKDATGGFFSDLAALVVEVSDKNIRVAAGSFSQTFARDDVEGALEAAIQQSISLLHSGGQAPLANIARELARAGTPVEQIIQSVEQISALTNLGQKPLSEYAQRLKDLNATFDQAIASAAGAKSAELALADAREKATKALREEFAESVLEQELARTDQLLAGFRAIVKTNADLLSDDLALNQSEALTASLRAGNFEDFFSQALAAGQSVTELAARMNEFEQVVKDLGGEVSALHKGFEQATAAASDLFNEQIQTDIGQFLDGPLDQLEKLLQAQKERLEQAEALGANIAEVERLTALELRKFFQGLTDQGLQEVQSFLGLFDEATNSVVRNLDLRRQDLQAQRDFFSQAAQNFAQLRTDFSEQFIAASPRESIDILRGRAVELLGQVGEGNQSAAQALPQVLNQLIDSARSTFGNTQGFVDVFNFVQDILRQAEDASLAVVSDTERQIAALDESNVLLADIRDILASSQAANAFFQSFASGGFASSEELLALIQQGAGLGVAANDNAAALNITGLIAQSVQPIIAPLAGSIDTFTQRLSDLPDLQRLQIEATDRVSETIQDVGDRLEASLDRLEILEKKVLEELENAA